MNLASPQVKRVALLYHPRVSESFPLAQEMQRQAESLGVCTWLCSAWDEEGIVQGLDDTDLLVTLGGDGTILRAARLAAPKDVPILGVNLGRIGFLAEISPQDWREQWRCILGGQYRLETRLMLRASHVREGESLQSFEALNDVVISRAVLARVVRLPTYINGDFLTTYVADGVIVSTATGSTAYSLAVDGPILPPDLHNILLIPIAPHLSFGRAIVLAEGATVRLQVQTDHEAILTVDGQFHVQVEDGDDVVVEASPYTCRFVRLRPPSYFYRTLMERLRWTV
ncbi:MAG: NAD(+)/NADH kinase [Chloroflexi bacterium]|nr:NAD(+)/NADH kinase [Chloroflexota bacterium]